MTSLNDFKELNEDRFNDWVAENKHEAMEDYFAGSYPPFNKDSYERYFDQYVEKFNKELWQEFMGSCPEDTSDSDLQAERMNGVMDRLNP
jgi:hypothetical protein